MENWILDLERARDCVSRVGCRDACPPASGLRARISARRNTLVYRSEYYNLNYHLALCARVRFGFRSEISGNNAGGKFPVLPYSGNYFQISFMASEEINRIGHAEIR